MITAIRHGNSLRMKTFSFIFFSTRDQKQREDRSVWIKSYSRFTFSTECFEVETSMEPERMSVPTTVSFSRLKNVSTATFIELRLQA